ncbi:MAG: hypothetical protein VX772_03710 [Bacteroidota bacterium]|nr:hypothetical protein [Bacteroidota bacterium]
MKKSLALCFAFSMSVVFFYAQSDKEKASGTVDKNTIESHIRFLSDDLLEGREAGTKGNKIAASYLASQLQKYGAKPVSENGFREPVSVTGFREIGVRETGFGHNFSENWFSENL